MKKILLILAVAISIQLAYTQKSAYTEMPNRLFFLGKEMYMDKNYVGATNTLHQFVQASKDTKLIEEAEYMLVSALYYQGKSGVDNRLKAYLQKYPASYHRNQIAFFVGSNCFRDKDWDNATTWLSQSNTDYLTLEDKEEHSYRLAYSHLQTGNIDAAQRLFSLLVRNSSKYQIPASYYSAYIDFNKKNYDKALPVFRKLKNSPTYKENATFFIIQGNYLEKNLSEVITESKHYINDYPNGENTDEVYRMLGNSYYRTGDIQQAIKYYEEYATVVEKPLREDMYQLADAYYSTQNTAKTVNTLKRVASTNDQLGQAGNMLLGQAYMKQNDTANALLAFDAAARSNHSPAISEEALYNYVMLANKGTTGSAFGESITALGSFLTKYPNSHYAGEINKTLATTLLSVSNYQMALDAINKIKQPDAQVLEAKQIVHYQLGVQDFTDGKYENSLLNFTAAINLGNYNMESKNDAYFWRGDAYYRLGNYKEAIQNYTAYTKLATASNANYAMAFYNMAYAQFQEKSHNAALDNFRKYTTTEKNTQTTTYADALNRMGDCYLFNRNFSQAEKQYAQAVNANPDQADYAEFQKAFVLGLQRNYSGKVFALDNMMRKYPNSPHYENALFEKSRALVMLDNETEAIKVIEQLLKNYPRTSLAPKAGVQLGQLYFNVNYPQKAIDAYKDVVKNYPNTEEARTAIKSMEGVYKEINDINSYAGYLQSSGKGNILSTSRQDSLTYLAAENVYMKDRKAEARIAFDKYLNTYDNGAFASDAHYFLGNMALDAKDKNSAAKHFREVIKSNNPKYIDDALIFVSGIEFEDADYQNAYNTYKHLSQAAVKSDNKNVGELGMLRCAYLLNQDNDVIRAANKLLLNTKLSEDVVNETLFYRGRSLSRLDRKQDAIADLKKVANNTRTAFGAESQYLLADIYLKLKQYNMVETQVMAFMKAGTSHQYWMARAIIVLADSYSANGDNFQAKQYLESLQANYKGTDDVKTIISERLALLSN